MWTDSNRSSKLSMPDCSAISTHGDSRQERERPAPWPATTRPSAPPTGRAPRDQRRLDTPAPSRAANARPAAAATTAPSRPALPPRARSRLDARPAISIVIRPSDDEEHSGAEVDREPARTRSRTGSTRPTARRARHPDWRCGTASGSGERFWRTAPDRRQRGPRARAGLRRRAPHRAAKANVPTWIASAGPDPVDRRHHDQQRPPGEQRDRAAPHAVAPSAVGRDPRPPRADRATARRSGSAAAGGRSSAAAAARWSPTRACAPATGHRRPARGGAARPTR